MVDLSTGVISFTHIKSEEFEPVPYVKLLDGGQKVTYYEELLSMAIIQRAHKKFPSITVSDHSKIFPYIKHILEWLRGSDFYTAPASTKYHDSCYAGLLSHTLEAYNQLLGLRSVPKFEEVVRDQWWSAVFVILVHDWCKIGRYEQYWKNVRENGGEWQQVPAYRYKEESIGRLGHGPQSLIMAMQLCNNKYLTLSFEEMASIRWHMDNWDSSVYDKEDLHQCDTHIPMVRMVQFADQLAITSY